jgi:mannose-6-phosphate isomerase-like protein (cupin superfamily)
MKVINIAELRTAAVYSEFLRVAALSLGLYRHDVGASVPQQPHTEDEVYLVISGRGVIAIAGTDHAVTSGSVAFVPAGAAHHFHTVTEELQVLVVFAPAEGTTGGRIAEG